MEFQAQNFFILGMAIIFISATPFVWKRLLHPLEKFGWVITAITSATNLITWSIGENIPLSVKTGIGIVSGIILIIVWYKAKKESSYVPNQQDYWDHIAKIRKSIEEDIASSKEIDNKLGIKNESELPDFYKIVNNSKKRKEILQHMITCFSYPDERVSKVMSDLLQAVNMRIEKFPREEQRNFSKDKSGFLQEIQRYFIQSFNENFQHLYQIMEDGKPRIGVCDGCIVDYSWEDKM